MKNGTRFVDEWHICKWENDKFVDQGITNCANNKPGYIYKWGRNDKFVDWIINHAAFVNGDGE